MCAEQQPRPKKTRSRERVNPSFERVEETGKTIILDERKRKFLFAIPVIRFAYCEMKS
jgi:hypothetical protein